jgi:hypothetical protein
MNCKFSIMVLNRLEVGRYLTLRRVVPILGVPDALVPVSLPSARISLLPGQISFPKLLEFLDPSELSSTNKS